jgi:hypothetical protein
MGVIDVITGAKMGDALVAHTEEKKAKDVSAKFCCGAEPPEGFEQMKPKMA